MADPPLPDGGGTATLHATTVALDGRGLLILGPSGSGKSALALELMAWGARLVADDRTIVEARAGALWARCPPPLVGMIEARGLGLLSADPVASCRLALAINLGTTETDRLPPQRSVSLLDVSLPTLHKPSSSHFAAAVLHYVRWGRRS